MFLWVKIDGAGCGHLAIFGLAPVGSERTLGTTTNEMPLGRVKMIPYSPYSPGEERT